MNQVLGPPLISKQALWILTLGTIPWINLWSQIHFFGMKVVIYGHIERREVPGSGLIYKCNLGILIIQYLYLQNEGIGSSLYWSGISRKTETTGCLCV